MDIDFVVLWVDGSDREWLARKQSFSDDGKNIDDGVNRYRDWEFLKYWFRAVEKNAPWVHKIFFVSCGQIPPWLNTGHEKLVTVNHDAYIPGEYLPTFNANTIEMNLHRIKELSEYFVYFNDDMFLADICGESDFFEAGLPCDQAAEEPYSFNERDVFNDILINDMVVINEHFNRKEVLKKYRGKFYNLKDFRTLVKNRSLSLLKREDFFGFEYQHLPQPFLKSMFERVWAENPERLNETCMHRFRNRDDINQYLIKYYQFVTGQFAPVNIREKGLAVHLNDGKDNNIDFACDCIRTGQYKLLCLNDAHVTDFESTKRKIADAFEAVYPDKCSFEL